MRYLRLSPIILGIAVFCSPAFAQSAVPQSPQKPIEPLLPGMTRNPPCATHHTFNSASLKREMAYCILLPADYEKSQRSYPVLYLLHGLWGSENDWLAKTDVAQLARSLPLIVVMPEGDDSWYTNSDENPGNRYEDYLFKDVIQHIESSYRVQKIREGRFLAGLSMGGYGTVKGATKYPQMFAAVGAFSSALGVAREDDGRGRFISIKLAFGKLGSQTRRDNDVFPLLAKADIAQLPYIFESCGERDQLEPLNLQFAQMLRNLDAAYEYHELPGAHEWPVWEVSLKLFLDSLERRKLLSPLSVSTKPSASSAP